MADDGRQKAERGMQFLEGGALRRRLMEKYSPPAEGTEPLALGVGF